MLCEDNRIGRKRGPISEMICINLLYKSGCGWMRQTDVNCHRHDSPIIDTAGVEKLAKRYAD